MNIIQLIARSWNCDLKPTLLGYELVPKYYPEGVKIMTTDERIQIERDKIAESNKVIQRILSSERNHINEYLKSFHVGDRVLVYKEKKDKVTDKSVKVLGVVQVISISDGGPRSELEETNHVEEIHKVVSDKEYVYQGEVRVFVVIPVDRLLDDIQCVYNDTHGIEHAD